MKDIKKKISKKSFNHLDLIIGTTILKLSKAVGYIHNQKKFVSIMVENLHLKAFLKNIGKVREC